LGWHPQHYHNSLYTRTSLKDVEKTILSDLEAIKTEEEFFAEGSGKQRFTNYYERNAKLRAIALSYHGTSCLVCGFDFGTVYGEHGAGFIEVHHKVPVSSLKKRTKVDPRRDMAVLCANCHRMIHRKRERVLSVEELKDLVGQAKI
jgi:predicted HNH restriction endonuclease